MPSLEKCTKDFMQILKCVSCKSQNPLIYWSTGPLSRSRKRKVLPNLRCLMDGSNWLTVLSVLCHRAIFKVAHPSIGLVQIGLNLSWIFPLKHFSFWQNNRREVEGVVGEVKLANPKGGRCHTQFQCAA